MSASPNVPDPKARFRARLSLFLSMAAVLLLVIFFFPLIFPVAIDVPSNVQFGSASAMMFQISNQNLTPLTDVEYSCVVAKLTLANGSPVTDANSLERGTVRTIAARHAVAGRCQTAYLITAPIKTIEYQVTVTYRAYPWPQQRKRVAHISAELNDKNEVTGWKRN